MICSNQFPRSRVFIEGQFSSYASCLLHCFHYVRTLGLCTRASCHFRLPVKTALKRTRWKPRTRMYSRSWTTSANLCNKETNLFLHASCAHTVSAKAPEQQFTKRLTSTTTSPPAQRNHNQHNNITSAMKPQRNHPHNEITSATKSQAQQHHQRNEITNTTNAPAERNHQRTAPAQQNHQSKRNH